jgi:hypothetical protein
MSRPRKRSKFVDDEADQSGSGHDGESDGADEATKEDMDFINDEEEENGYAGEDGHGDDGMLCDIKKIRIRKSERKLSKDDYRLILENAGIKSASKRAKKKSSGKKKKVYKDSDEEGVNSGDEGFIATSSDDGELSEEDAGREMQASIHNYVQKQGISLKKGADVTVAARQGSTLTFMEKDAFYLAVEAESGHQQPEQQQSDDHGGKPVPLCMRLGRASKPKVPDAAVPEPKAIKPPKAAAAKPAAKAVAAKATVRPMDAHTRKVAPIFLGRQQAIKDAAAAQNGKNKKLETGIIWNSKEGKAYVRHKNGLMTPHEL